MLTVGDILAEEFVQCRLIYKQNAHRVTQSRARWPVLKDDCIDVITTLSDIFYKHNIIKGKCTFL